MSLNGKIAIVTGAGGGIGKAIALRFAKDGAHVVAADIDEKNGVQTLLDLEQYSQNHLFVHTDMAKLDAIESLVSQTLEAFGHVDILVNNAGVTKKLGFFEVTESDWDWIHSINAKGVFFCMQAVAQAMVKRCDGKIINIASISGKGFRGASNIAYAGSKGAVIAITRLGALQLAPYNINVNSICPGITETGLYQRSAEQLAKREGISEADARARIDSGIPLDRHNSPDDVANLAAFLASSEARNVTGQSFNVDGGLTFD